MILTYRFVHRLYRAVVKWPAAGGEVNTTTPPNDSSTPTSSRSRNGYNNGRPYEQKSFPNLEPRCPTSFSVLPALIFSEFLEYLLLVRVQARCTKADKSTGHHRVSTRGAAARGGQGRAN